MIEKIILIGILAGAVAYILIRLKNQVLKDNSNTKCDQCK